MRACFLVAVHEGQVVMAVSIPAREFRCQLTDGHTVRWHEKQNVAFETRDILRPFLIVDPEKD